MVLHEARLLRKGWSAGEIAHARQVLERFGTARAEALLTIERATLALLIFLVTVGSGGIGYVTATLLSALPTHLVIGVPLALGACVGALAWHAIHTLQTHSVKARIAVGLMVACGGIAFAAGAAGHGGRWFLAAVAFTVGLGALTLVAVVRSVRA